MSKAVTFVGDIHGCFKTFKALLNKIPKEDNRIILLGDIINKGKRSYETFAFVKKHNFEMLLGNHEYYCIYRNKPASKEAWYRLGGVNTINSIKRNLHIETSNQVQVILAEMSYFFKQAKPFVTLPTAYGKNIIATHGGISKKVYQQNNHNVHLCLNIEKGNPNSFLFNKAELAIIPDCIQVIGHKPMEKNKYAANGNYMMDTGCVYNKTGMGWLSAIMFDLEEERPPVVIQQVNID